MRAGFAVAFAALAAALAASPAHAAIGYESNVLVPSATREHLAAMAHEARADSWVRITIYQATYRERLPYYEEAINVAREHGSRVLVTLTRWRARDGTEQPGVTPAEWRTFTRQVVSRLGSKVDAWSPMNEPNHPAFAPRVTTTCVLRDSSRSSTSIRVVNGQRAAVTFKRSRHGSWQKRRGGRWVKVSRRKFYHLRHRWLRHHRKLQRQYRRYRHLRHRWIRHHRHLRHDHLRHYRHLRHRWGRHHRGLRHKFRRYRRLRRKWCRHHRRYRRDVVTVDTTARSVQTLSTPIAWTECQREALATAYRRVYDAVAPIIRQLDPTATLVLGDVAGEGYWFMRAVVAANPTPVDADVVGTHYTANLGRMVRWARGRGWAVWSTEYGLPFPQPDGTLLEAIRTQRETGAPVTILYGFQGPDAWRDQAILNPDGTARHAWYALRDR